MEKDNHHLLGGSLRHEKGSAEDAPGSHISLKVEMECSSLKEALQEQRLGLTCWAASNLRSCTPQ
jgi:hypothetical protein